MGNLKSIPRLWNNNQIDTISTIMIKYNEFRPDEIHRKIRSLTRIHFWKATEFRSILHYVGIVLLKDFLPISEYQLFLKLFCAVTICSTKKYALYLPLARTLFTEYIEGHINIYGIDSITSNVHNLSHVVDDVEMFGDLSTISAYEFENCLHLMKLLLKQCNKPLEQLARRLDEISQTNLINPNEIDKIVPFPIVKDQFICFESQFQLAYKKIECSQNMLLCNDNKNRWVILNNQTIVRFEFAYKIGNRYMFRGHPINSEKENFFTRPFNSSHLNIFLSDSDVGSAQNYDLNQIKAKLFCLPYHNKFVFVPLLHTL